MIAVVGSINLDLSVHVPVIPAVGETVLGTSFAQSPGGKGANQAVAAARLGSRVAFVGCLGKDAFGDALEQGLRENGVDTAYIRRTGTCESGIALIQVDRAGHNNIVVVPGSNFALTEEDLDRAADCFREASLMMFQLEVPIPVVEAALCRARAAGCKTLLNPAPARPLTEKILRCTDILAPNQIELAMLTGLPCESEAELEKAAGILRAGGAGLVVVTLGERGAMLAGPKGVSFYPARKVTAVDTTAAGDAFLGGLAHGLEQGYTIEEAVRIGQDTAAYAVQKHGAQPSLPTWRELQSQA